MTLSLDRTPQFSQPIRSMPQWVSMTWAEYEQWRDGTTSKTAQWYFDRNLFLVRDMGWEGIVHAQVKDLFILLISLWFMSHPDRIAQSMSGGLLEKPGLKAASPDLMLYVGPGCPEWQPGETRRINLDRWRVPDLVGEVADTTLASDLDEMKQIYAALMIPEYWVIDVQGRRMLMFCLVAGKYQEVETSVLMPGVTIALLEETIDRWATGTNISAATWFMQQISRSDS
jgi:Uma2 family endonuclease